MDMLFQIYGETAMYQLLGFVLVFTGLVLANEFARRTKAGGIICFLVLPAALTVYFIDKENVPDSGECVHHCDDEHR